MLVILKNKQSFSANKKIILILLLILIFVGLIKIYLITRPTPQPIVSLPQPEIPSLPEAPTNLQYSFEKSWPDFPKELFVYKIINKPAFSLAEMEKIAVSLGFTNEPTIAKDIETGLFYNWSNEKEYLAIGGNPPSVSFGLLTSPSATTSANFSQTDAINLSQKFLKEKGLINPFINIALPIINMESSNLRISYQFLLSGLPLLNNHGVNPISFLFNKEGKLLKMDFVKDPDSLEKKGAVDLLLKETALRNLQEQKGLVVYFADDQNQNLDTPVNYAVSLSQIEKVSLAYYYPTDPLADLLLPFFVFEGKGVDAQTGKIIKITTLLPATP